MVKIGDSTYVFNYTFLKNVTKQLFDIDVEHGNMPIGAYTLGTLDGRFLAAYDGVSWVRPDENGVNHVEATLIWLRTYREVSCLGDYIHGGDKFKQLAQDAGKFAVFQLSRSENGSVLVRVLPPEKAELKPPVPQKPNLWSRFLRLFKTRR